MLGHKGLKLEEKLSIEMRVELEELTNLMELVLKDPSLEVDFNNKVESLNQKLPPVLKRAYIKNSKFSSIK